MVWSEGGGGAPTGDIDRHSQSLLRIATTRRDTPEAFGLCMPTLVPQIHRGFWDPADSAVIAERAGRNRCATGSSETGGGPWLTLNNLFVYSQRRCRRGQLLSELTPHDDDGQAMTSVKIGEEILRDTRRPIQGRARATGDNHSFAAGVENGSLGDDPNSYEVTVRGTLRGTAEATSDRLRAEANGIWNEGTIRLTTGSGVVRGSATASTEEGGVRTFATGINSSGPDSSIIFDRRGRIEGSAEATGQRNTRSFGVILADVQGDDGKQEIIGNSKITTGTLGEARGVTIGLSDVTEAIIEGRAPRQVATTSGNAEIGNVFLGAGDDLIEGNARVVIDANDGEFVTFAKGLGVRVDGPTLAQVEELLSTIGKDLTNFTGSDIEQILSQLDTSTLDMGSGNDRIVADVSMTAAQRGVGRDDDLEIIADGFENAGTARFGDGNDSIVVNVDIDSTILGAKALAQGIDNSSVGILTALKIGLNEEVLLDMGAGDDRIVSRVTATGVNDLVATDGVGNQAVMVMGLGNDTIDVVSETTLNVVERDDTEQQSSIAHGIENRGKIYLDDPDLPGGGDDLVRATAIARGNGLQTRAEAIESRALIDAGAGNDTFLLDATAITDTGPNEFLDNLTQAAGLQLEQVIAGTFLLGEGDDLVDARGTAISGNNRATLAFGITQVTADRTAPGDYGLFDAGNGDDVVRGFADATAVGNTQAQSHGLLFTNAFAGAGHDRFTGEATTTAGNLGTSNGVRVGVSNGNVSINGQRLPEPLLPANAQEIPEPGSLDLGSGQNTLIGTGQAVTSSDGVATLFSDVNGILVDIDSSLTAGDGGNTITGIGEAIDQGVGGGAFDFAALSAVSVDGIEIKGSLITGDGDDIITGNATGEVTNSFLVSDGIDIGLGSTQNGFPVRPIVDLGNGNNQLLGNGVGTATGDEAAVITAGVQNTGTIRTGSGDDRIVAESTSTLIGGANGVRGSIAEGLQNGIEFRGVETSGAIDLGGGSNTIEARAVATSTDSTAFAAGISQSRNSVITMGDGNDSIHAEALASSGVGAQAFGINDGIINMGGGDDLIHARSNIGPLEGGFGFGGGVRINMGAGNDVVTGFGEAIVDGGEGEDTLRFEFTRDDFENAGGSMEIVGNFMSFSLGETTMLATNFEIVEFADETFSAARMFSLA